MNKDKQEENKNKKKKQQDREEYGYGYDISVNDLDRLGQNESAKTNKNRVANHPISNDDK
ncbi:MAG: hypothetical protein ACE3JQ_04785 [Paenisporosarcina sp.]